MPKKSVKKSPVGRPTDYRKKYCREIIDYFEVEYQEFEEQVASQGKAVTVKKNRLTKFPTIEGFCVEIGITKETLHRWVKKHEEFSDAYKIAKQKQKQILVQGGLTSEFNSSFAKFVAVNCTDLVDKSEVKTENEHNVKGYGLAFDLTEKPE